MFAMLKMILLKWTRMIKQKIYEKAKDFSNSKITKYIHEFRQAPYSTTFLLKSLFLPSLMRFWGVHLQPCNTSMIELFWEKCSRFLAVYYFCKTPPLQSSKYIGYHPFVAYPKLSTKISFLTPWYEHVNIQIRAGRNFVFPKVLHKC